MMKTYKLLLLSLLLSAPLTHAEQVMGLITDTGRTIALSQVNCLIASEGESTMAVLLNDGLTLSGISHVTFDMVDDAGITSAVGDTQAVTYVNRSIVITGAQPGSPVMVADMAGRTVVTATVTTDPCIIDVSSLTSGQGYIVNVNGKTTKIVKR